MQCSTNIVTEITQLIWMKFPSWTTPYLDVPFTPPVCKTYTFHQDFSSRDNLMLTIKVYTLKLSYNDE